MSKIVFLGGPAHGHVNPTLPVVQELVQRGETVIYYNTEEFRAKIEHAGAQFRAYPPNELTSVEISNALQHGNMGNVGGLLLRAADNLLPFTHDELQREQPDLVIFDTLVVWGRIAASLLNLRAVGSVPHFVTGLDSMNLTGREAVHNLGQILPKLPGMLLMRRRLIQRYGDAFPRNSPFFPMRGGINLIYTSREFHPPTKAIDDSFRFVGPSINPQTGSEDFPFDALRDGKAVYISLGTVHHGQTEFYRQCFAAFADYPAQFILSIGSKISVESLGTIPQNFIVRPFVPQLEVLQRADVFITHGGMNSVHEGLYYGVPLIVIPQQMEQLFVARRVEEQGAGLVINRQVIGQKVTADDLRQGLDAILSDTSYREGAAKVQQSLHATGGYKQAADEIQAYIAMGEKESVR